MCSQVVQAEGCVNTVAGYCVWELCRQVVQAEGCVNTVAGYRVWELCSQVVQAEGCVNRNNSGGFCLKETPSKEPPYCQEWNNKYLQQFFSCFMI